MEQPKRRQLVVYLSKSLQTSEKELEVVKKQLTASGFLISEYKGGRYDPAMRANADFMLLVPRLRAKKVLEREWHTQVGKGQYSEVQAAIQDNQQSFIYMGHKGGETLMSKINEDLTDHFTTSAGNWKTNYGTVSSFVIANAPAPLYDFITGYMRMSRGIEHVNFNAEFPMMPSEAYSFKRNMLLLIN